MHYLARWLCVLGALLGALLIAGYLDESRDDPGGAAGALGLPFDPVPPPGAAPPPAPTEPVPVVPIGPGCTPGQLFVSFAGGSIGSGQYQGQVVVINLGVACHLRGQPTVVGVDAAGHDVDVTAPDLPPGPPEVVNLAPEQSRSLSYRGVQRYLGAACPGYARIVLTVPGIPRRFTVPENLCGLSAVWDSPDAEDADRWVAPEPVPVAGTPPERAPTCVAENLSARTARVVKQRGRRLGRVVLIANAGPPCTLAGYPTLRETVSTRQDQVARRREVGAARPTPRGVFGGLPAGSDGPPAVRLGTAEVASVLYEGRVPALDGPPSCPPWTELELTLPGQRVPTYLGTDDPQSLCDLEVHPVLPGLTGGATSTISRHQPLGVLGPVPTPQPASPPCRTDQLEITFGTPVGGIPADPALADLDGVLTFTNRGPPCGMYGYPTLTAVDAAGRELIRTEPTLFGIRSGLTFAPIPAVDLASGRSATADYLGYDVATSATSCPRYTAFLVAPPGGGAPVSVPHTGTRCALQVNPVN